MSLLLWVSNKTCCESLGAAQRHLDATDGTWGQLNWHVKASAY